MTYNQKTTGLTGANLAGQTISLDANWKTRAGSEDPNNAILVYGGASGTVAVSTDAAESWTPVTLPDPPNFYCDDPAPTQDDLFFVGFQTFPGVNGLVYALARFVTQNQQDSTVERSFVGVSTDFFADPNTNFSWIYPSAYICTDACALSYQLDADGGGFRERGLGDLTKDGASRVLTAVEHPSNGFYYVSFRVGPASTLSVVTSCSNEELLCRGTSDQSFDLIIESVTAGQNAGSTGGKCTNGTYSAVWTGGGYSTGVKYNVTGVEFIGTSSFTITCKLGDTGTL